MGEHKKKDSFKILDSHSDIFERIKEESPAWWKLFCEDDELYIDIRKENYISIYYYGGSLAKIEYKNSFTASIHEKYMGIDGKDYADLDLRTLNKNKIKKIKERIKINYLDKGNPEKPAEKKIQGEMILRNSNYIDSEFQYNQDVEIGKLRIDLIELSNGKLSFVELKGITDSRLRNDEKRNSKIPEIIEQIEKYQSFINKYELEIIDYYKRLIQLKNDLGLSKHSIDFTLNKTPKLLIVDTYKKTTKGREERINDIKKMLETHSIKCEFVKRDDNHDS